MSNKNNLFSEEESLLVIESLKTQLQKEKQSIKDLDEFLALAGEKFAGDPKNLKEAYVITPDKEPAPLMTCIRKIKMGLAEKKLKLLQLTMCLNKTIAVHDCIYNGKNE